MLTTYSSVILLSRLYFDVMYFLTMVHFGRNMLVSERFSYTHTHTHTHTHIYIYIYIYIYILNKQLPEKGPWEDLDYNTYSKSPETQELTVIQQ